MLGPLLRFSDALRHRARSRTWPHAKALGRYGEDLAHRFLQREGFIVVARNYRMESGAGEIDIVARDGEHLAFVEVKTRQTTDFGAPDRAVGFEKQRSMLRAARDYSRRSRFPWTDVRFDIVNVVNSQPPAVEHLRDVLPVVRPDI